MGSPRMDPTVGGRCEEHRPPTTGAEGAGQVKSMAGKRGLRLSSLLVLVVVLSVVASISMVNISGVASQSLSRRSTTSAAEAPPARGPVTKAASPAGAP